MAKRISEDISISNVCLNNIGNCQRGANKSESHQTWGDRTKVGEAKLNARGLPGPPTAEETPPLVDVSNYIELLKFHGKLSMKIGTLIPVSKCFCTENQTNSRQQAGACSVTDNYEILSHRSMWL